jgi:hypothetical protein
LDHHWSASLVASILAFHGCGNLQAKPSQLLGQPACIGRCQAAGTSQSAKHFRFQHQSIRDVGRIDDLGKLGRGHQRTVS